MITSATLNYIAEECQKHFEVQGSSILWDCKEVFEFIKTELKNDDITRGVDYESLRRGFEQARQKTASIPALIEMEINAVKSLLGSGLEAWHNQRPKNHFRAYNEIRSFILLGKTDFDVFSFFYPNIDLYKLVSSLYCYEVIKYQIYLEHEAPKLANKQASDQKADKKKIPAPVIALFCTLVDDSGIKPKGKYDETVANYCIRICKDYNLIYSDRVRQNFSTGNSIPRNIEKVQRLIFPLIDNATKEAITNYLNSKKQPQQKLYG